MFIKTAGAIVALLLAGAAARADDIRRVVTGIDASVALSLP
jgi:hypothetical protein